MTRVLILFLLLCQPLRAGDKPPIRLPEVPAVPTPMPPPPVPPSAVTKLKAGQHYVIDCSVECVVRAHPAGLVKVTAKKGPRDMSAVFADGTGVAEDRTYDGPFIYDVTVGTGVGTVEIDVVPVGLKAEADIKSARLDVDDGTKPIPSPVVDPATPVVPLTPLEQAISTAFKADGATAADLAKYAALWRKAATTTIDDADYKTFGDFYADLQTAVKNIGIAPGSLNKTARGCADAFNAAVKLTTSAPLDAATRAAVKAELALIASALEKTANGK